MKNRLLYYLLFCLLAGAVSVSAQDLGPAPDTVSLVVTKSPSALAGQDTLEIQLWVYNDDLAKNANAGFKWDNPNFQLIGAEATPLADDAFDLIVGFFEDGNMATSNANQRFLFAGARLFKGMTGATTRRHWATYRWVTSSWTEIDSIVIDTNRFNQNSTWVFVNANTVGYQPIWEQGPGGSLVIYDPNRPEPKPSIVVDSTSLGFVSDVNTGVQPPHTFHVTSDGAPLNVSISTNVSWLTLDPTSGTTPLSVDVTPDNTGLSPNVYFGNVYTTSPDAANADTMLVVFEVRPEPPVITCPNGPIDTIFNAPGQLCVDLPIEGATATNSTAGGIIVEGLICYGINGPFSAVDTVTAFNAGGLDTCIIDINVAFGDLPIINCPITSLSAVSCGAGQVCVPLTISNADVVTADLDAVWTNDTLCFTADTTGLYFINVVATNGVGADSCDISVNVNINDVPAIACPTEPVVVPEVEGPSLVCVEIAATDVDDSMVVTPSPGSWDNDTLCFVADTAGTYSFELIANGTCGADTCTVDIVVPFASCNALVFDSKVIQFVDTLDGMADTLVATVNVTSSGEIACFEVFDDAEDWLTLSVDSTCTPSVVTFTAIPGGLPANTYFAAPMIIGDSTTCSFPDSLWFEVTLSVIDTASPADTIRIVNRPAVPGAQVRVPIRVIGSCDITQVLTNLTYPTEYLTLDSIMFDNSPFGDSCNQKAIIDDASGTFSAHFTTCEDASIDTVPAGNNLFADLYFSVAVEAPHGYYPIKTNKTYGGGALLINKLCGGSPLQVTPAFVEGGLIVDTTGNYVCGYVVDPDGQPIPHAGVWLYGDYPDGDTIATTIANGDGAWAFSDFTAVPFDLYAFAPGYYPNTELDVNFGEVGIMIVLQPVGPVHPTPEWVDFYCEYSTFMGRPLPVGSIIEAFDPDGVRCGVAFVAEEGKYGFMPVYRDDAYSSGDQGADPGDLIRFYVNGIEAIATGERIWTTNGDNFEVCLEVGEPEVFTCELKTGWNLISWNLDQTPDNITSFLAPISECLELVLGFERGGLVYDPTLPEFSTLWQVDHLSGYWVKVSCDVSLPIDGVPVPMTTPIPLDQGWNLVSYLPADTQLVEDALASIMSDLLVALGFDNGGTIYVPGDEFNTLTDMMPCHGYWLKVDKPSSLVYGSDGPIAAGRMLGQPLASGDDAVIPTNRWISAYGRKLKLDNNLVPAGAEITAHAENGDLVGRAAIREDGAFGFMPVYAGQEGHGLNDGDQFYFSVNGTPTNERFTWTTFGDKLEVVALSASGSGDPSVPYSFSLSQNYPNPFNPSTNISFTLPQATKARLEIYNILGKLVAVPLDGLATAGENTVVWDGRSQNGETAASGVYFYRLTAGEYSETRKMTLLK